MALWNKATKTTEEIWKDISFDPGYTNQQHLQISNHGRVRNLGKQGGGRILEGSGQGGYRIIRLKLFRPRDEKTQVHFDMIREQIKKLSTQLTAIARQLKAGLEDKQKEAQLKRQQEEGQKLLAIVKKKYEKHYKADERKRTDNLGLLVHRLVAEYFLERPSPEHNLVIHLDFDKTNNDVSNLQWATQAESTAHQQNSPAVIADKKARPGRRPETSKTYKLTTTRVMLIKKRISEGKSLRLLSKQFKVTETQLLRIKRGENWKDIPAAE